MLNLKQIQQNNIDGMFLGLDVESGDTTNLDKVMSIGYAVVDVKGNLIEKNTIYFPFHESDLQYDKSPYDAFTFWTINNKNIYEKHVEESKKLGFDPNHTFPINTKSKEFKKCVTDCMKKLSDTLFRIQNEYNILAIVTDCQYDTTVINHLLWKILNEPSLIMRRVFKDNKKSFVWNINCIDTGSFVASVYPNVKNLKMSETFFIESNKLLIPDSIITHTHSPDDDCERMLMEFLIIWNYCLESK